MAHKINAEAEAKQLSKLFDRHAVMSQAEFGRKYGLGSSSMVNQYLKARRTLGLIAGAKFAIGLGVDLRSISPRLADELKFALKALPQAQPSTDQSPEYARVLCVDMQLQANMRGYKATPLGTSGAFIAFRHDWLRNRCLDSARLLAVQVNDDGMKPTVASGDLVVINTADRKLDDAVVFAVNYEGELRIRRLVRDVGAWWLYCDNPDIQRFPKKQFIAKHCYILGRIVHRQSETI